MKVSRMLCALYSQISLADGTLDPRLCAAAPPCTPLLHWRGVEGKWLRGEVGHTSELGWAPRITRPSNTTTRDLLSSLPASSPVEMQV